MTHVFHSTLLLDRGCEGVVIVAEWASCLDSRRVAHVLTTAINWVFWPWPHQEISLVSSRKLLDVKQKTSAHEHYIAPRPREGNPRSSAAGRVSICPKQTHREQNYVRI